MGLWIAYLLGQALHAFKRATLSSDSPLTPWNSIREFFASHWPVMVVRIGLASAFFFGWMKYPVLVAQLSDVVASNLSPGLMHDAIAKVQFPLNLFTAFLFGYFADSIFDWLCEKVPSLKSQIPEIKP